VTRGNITVLDDLGEWWTLIRDGAEPAVDAADQAFVAEALALLPPRPWSDATWGEWTGAVKAATGRKGKDLFMPLRKALTGRARGPEMADLMPLLHKVPAV
jgi:glutamyl-tRNA synthetase